MHLEVRLEAFNLLNRVNFALPNRMLDVVSSGAIRPHRDASAADTSGRQGRVVRSAGTGVSLPSRLTS